MWVNGKAKEPAPRNSSGTQTARRMLFVPQGNRRYSGNGEVKGAGRRPAVRQATAKERAGCRGIRATLTIIRYEYNFD